MQTPTPTELKNRIDNLKTRVFRLYNEIDDLKQEISSIESELWHSCQHEWVRDPWANFDDLCKHICNHCGLYKNDYFYKK